MISTPIKEASEVVELLPLSSPGEFIRLEFLDPLAITPYRLAKDIGVQQTRIEAILDGHRTITPDTAERLGRYFGMGTRFWLNLQHDYDMRKWNRERVEANYEHICPHPGLGKMAK